MSLPKAPVEIEGRPITPEIQEVFGAFGGVTGIIVQTLSIDVYYDNGLVVTFTPAMHKEKQR